MVDKKAAYEERWAKTEAVGIEVITETYRIEGMLHKLPSVRVSDAMNNPTQAYISLNKVAVYTIADNKLLFQREFLLVDKAHIVLMTERPERKEV